MGKAPWMDKSPAQAYQERTGTRYISCTHISQKWWFNRFFTKTSKENRIKQEDGKIRIEGCEEEAYIDANGDVYYSDQIEAALKALKSDKEHSAIQK